MVRDLPADSYWSVAGIGNTQRMMNSVAIACGGGVRTGMEDNIWYDSARTRLATNRELVERVRVIADAVEAVPYTRSEARELLGL